MRYGVREICDVVLRAKARQKVGNKIFYKNEPVIYFDTLKTSSLEGAATTVYAQGGKGNARLIAWEGERTVTYTMEDALISPEGFMILSGAGLIEAGSGTTIKQHVTETIDYSALDVTNLSNNVLGITLSNEPYVEYNADDTPADNFIYVMLMKDGEIISEPYIPCEEAADDTDAAHPIDGKKIFVAEHKCYDEGHDSADGNYLVKDLASLRFDSVLVDYYVERESGARQIEITPDKFGGNYYLEASTLFRDTNGVDMPAEFIIPNCKIQSNFTFTMASSGDPSSFTFTMDAFPDYTRFDHSKKVLAAIQMIETEATQDVHRGVTNEIEPGSGSSSQSSKHENLRG